MRKYRYLLILLDVVANTVADMYANDIMVRLYAFLLQDLSLLLSLLIILLGVFHEDILRARLMGRMIAAHFPLLVTSLTYIAFTVSWQALHKFYSTQNSLGSIQLAHCLGHRLSALIYYFKFVAKPIPLPTTQSHDSHLDQITS